MSRGGRGARGRSFPRTDRLKNDAGEFQPPPLYPVNLQHYSTMNYLK